VRGDGSGRRVLGTGDGLDSPDPWSPDGKRIAWGGCGGLCVYDFASAVRTRIRLGQPESEGFSWLPDGSGFVVSDLVRGLVVVDRKGKTLRVLAKTGDHPAVSPEGGEVAFVAGRKLELVPAAGGRVRVLDKAAGGAPSWSPGGRRLLYTDTRPQAGYGYGNVRVADVATGSNRRVSDGDMAQWSPGGAMIAFGRDPGPFYSGDDLWLVRANGGPPRQLTDQFPTGLGYTDLDWARGSVPAGPPPPAPQLVDLTATSARPLEYLGDLSRAESPDSVAYTVEDMCDPVAETSSSRLTVWSASTGNTSTTTTPCEDLPVESYAVTPSLAAWCIQENPVNGVTMLEAARSRTTRAPAAASWTSEQDAPDIGWRSFIGPVVGDGTTIVFETENNDGSMQLWRIDDSGSPHAVQIPAPPDATDLLDADAGRILVRTGKNGYAVLRLDGGVLARVSGDGTARLGGDLLAVASGDVLRVYAADAGSLRYQLPLSHATGKPRLLAVGYGYAVYASGIALHLLRLDDGTDRIADLPGQAGPVEALLTADGLFLSYFEAYNPVPGRLLFVATANLP
jgi:hypothetical protein